MTVVIHKPVKSDPHPIVPLSFSYNNAPVASCFTLLRHCMFFALIFAAASAGSSSAAKMAMMAITTSNSISVKPARSVTRQLINLSAPFAFQYICFHVMFYSSSIAVGKLCVLEAHPVHLIAHLPEPVDNPARPPKRAG